MNVNEDGRPREDLLVGAVVGAAYEVSNTLGAGFLEKVYERALVEELRLRGLNVQPQAGFTATYKGRRVGEYVADLIVEDRLVVELKCVDAFSNEHLAQCISYLRASGKTLALLLNFQRPKPQWRRVIYGSHRAAGRPIPAANKRE